MDFSGLLFELPETALQLMFLLFRILASLLFSLESGPLHLLGMLVLTGLSLHLLDFDCVGLATTQVELVVAHAKSQDALVDAKTGSKEDKVLHKYMYGNRRKTMSLSNRKTRKNGG